LAAALPGLALAGCSSAGTPELGSLPKLDDLPKLPELSDLVGADRITGSPTEVYTRVARGVLTCWFGAEGPLKGPYIYHADADPPSKGGRSEIVIHNRDNSVPDSRSVRAFRIGISPGAERTIVEVENSSVPEPLATRLKADAIRWASNEEGCADKPMSAGWSAEEAAKAAADRKLPKKADKAVKSEAAENAAKKP